jgi:predicted Rossmann-fold nucleotide-binding protein
MFEAADAFVSLPGGLGTLDETIEIITWRQLRLHDKPVLLCDIAGSAAPFLATIEAAIAADFALPDTRRLFEVVRGVPAVLERLAHLHRAGISEAARL